MPHREKLAWLYLIAMAVAFVPYFTYTAMDPPTDALPDMGRLMRLAAALIGQAVVLGIGYLLLWVSNRTEARAPADERDKAIERRALGVAYYVLIAGAVAVGCFLPFTDTGWSIVNSAVGAVLLAEVVHYGVVVWSYRRGVA
ncbi:MAG TPA: hypothetical protein VH987_11275 [Candidatus Limnocylindria bacterium]|jgi:hypothetical protein